MNNQNILISTAMLTSINDDTGSDRLDLLLPFVKYCIGESTGIKKTIDKEAVVSRLGKEFGFLNLPNGVFEKMLYRLQKEGALQRKKDKNYILANKDKLRNDEFERRWERAQRETDEVAQALSEFINKRKPSLKATKERAKEWLSSFLSDNGLNILDSVPQLGKKYKGSEGTAHFYVAHFIITEEDAKSKLFRSILSFAKGMMLTTIIYLDTDNEKKNLKDLNVYFDTTFLLYALHFKTDYHFDGAQSLINLLKDNGAQMFCLKHTYLEIDSILRNYANRFEGKKYIQTLEFFDERGYRASDIDRVRETLLRKIQEIGISIVEKQSYLKENGEPQEGVLVDFDYKGLRESLHDKILGYQRDPDDRRLNTDMDSLCTMQILRKGVKVSRLENCHALFVTTNSKLVRITNEFMGFWPNQKEIGLAMSDTELVTILWTRYGSTANNSIPKVKLIEYARAAIEPTDDVMSRFKEVIEHMREEGAIKPEEAAFLRENIYWKRKIMDLANGEPEQINEYTVRSLADELREKYASESTPIIAGLEEEKKNYEEQLKSSQEQRDSLSEQLRDRDEELKESRMLLKKEKEERQKDRIKNNEANKEMIDEAYRKAEQIAREKAKGTAHKKRIISQTFMGIVCVIAAIAVFQDACPFLEKALWNIIMDVILLFISLGGVITIWDDSFNFFKKKEKIWEDKEFQKNYNAELDKIEIYFGTSQQD